MKAFFDQYPHIVAYIDGSCRNNPGIGGAGVAFFGKKSSVQDPMQDDVATELDLTDSD